MPTPKTPDGILRECYADYLATGRNISETARMYGISRRSVTGRIKEFARRFPDEVAEQDAPRAAGRISVFERRQFTLPKRGKVARHLLTSAQNNTHLHGGVWENLQALAAHYRAEIHVSRFAYNVAAFGQPANSKPGTHYEPDELWYSPELVPHFSDDQAEIAPGLIWCGEMNIRPTAIRPLSGLHSYTGSASCVIPHVKITLESVATPEGQPAKLMYTTGTVTLRNYIQRKEGLKAERLHAYGALLVEVTPEGDWYCRQIHAAEDGELWDCDIRVADGKVTTGNRVTSITWGDIHVAQLDPIVRRLAWGKGGMLDTLRPEHQQFHDLVDNQAVNRHDRRNPHERFRKYVMKTNDVRRELEDAAAFLAEASRPWCTGVVIPANHDRWLDLWLQEMDYREDPQNAPLFLEAQAEAYRRIAAGEELDIMQWALRRCGAPDAVRFLQRREEYILLREIDGGVDCSMHGDRGANGSRGSAAAYARMARKTISGHSHTAEIRDEHIRTGCCCLLEQGYNAGPSSWSHTQVVTYPTTARAAVTMWNGRWRA